MLGLLIKILELISPELRAAIGKFLDELQVKAEATDTMADDILVFVLRILLGCPKK